MDSQNDIHPDTLIAVLVALETFRIRTPLDNEIIDLSQSGWFLNYCMTPVETQRLVNDFMNGNMRKVNSGFVDWLSDHCHKQKQRLIRLFPDAKKLIAEAFLMHKKGYYHSSICLFLIISDHISRDSILKLTGLEPYNGIYSLNGIAMKKLKDRTDNMMNGMNLFLPLVRDNSINQSDKIQKSNPKQNINRHAILHGKNVVFGNKLNSFKALSFLIFVLDSIRVLSRQSEKI